MNKFSIKHPKPKVNLAALWQQFTTSCKAADEHRATLAPGKPNFSKSWEAGEIAKRMKEDGMI